MDQATVDVTGVPGVAIGDEVVLLGSPGDETLDASGIWLTFKGQFPGRYCARSAPGFHVCFVIDNGEEGIYGYHRRASKDISDL